MFYSLLASHLNDSSYYLVFYTLKTGMELRPSQAINHSTTPVNALVLVGPCRPGKPGKDLCYEDGTYAETADYRVDLKAVLAQTE